MTDLTLTSSGHSSVQRVANAEQLALWTRRCRHAHKMRNELARQIAAAAANGKRTGHLVRNFLHNENVLLSAVLKTLGSDTDEGTVLSLLERVDAWKSNDNPVRWYAKPKSKGGFRPICSGIEDDLRVVHQIVKWCLEKQYVPPTSMFGVTGKGRDDVVRVISMSIREGYNHLAKMDIKDCFQSIDPESLYQLPLPKEVIRQALDTRNLTFSEIPVPYMSDLTFTNHCKQSEPRGLMQGSPASNIILAWLLPELPTTDDARVFVCTDNIVVAAKTERACRAMIETLDQLFAGCPSGSLVLHEKGYAAPGTDVFDFLGYSLDPDGGEIGISPASLTKKETKLLQLWNDPSISGEDLFIRAGRQLRSYPNGYAAAAGATHSLEPHLEIGRLTFTELSKPFLAEMFTHLLDPKDTEEGWFISRALQAPMKRKRN